MNDLSPIEQSLAKHREVRAQYMIAGGGMDNRPLRVYRMVGAHEDDTPCFVGADADCYDWIEARALPAAIAEYLRAEAERRGGSVLLQAMAADLALGCEPASARTIYAGPRAR